VILNRVCDYHWVISGYFYKYIIYTHTHTHTHTHIYIYIYIERERERYIYIHILYVYFIQLLKMDIHKCTLWNHAQWNTHIRTDIYITYTLWNFWGNCLGNLRSNHANIQKLTHFIKQTVYGQLRFKFHRIKFCYNCDQGNFNIKSNTILCLFSPWHCIY